VDFAPGAKVLNHTAHGASDGYLQELSAGGNFVRADRWGGEGADTATGIAIDTSGNTYITGKFTRTADFNPSNTAVVNLTAQNKTDGDAYVLKLANAGAFVYARDIGGSNGLISPNGIATGGGNVYTVGAFGGTVDFDPGSATQNRTADAESQKLWVLSLTQFI
jgi:hypothetical protein